MVQFRFRQRLELPTLVRGGCWTQRRLLRLVPCLGLLATACSPLGDSYVVDNHYATYQAAHAAGALSSGAPVGTTWRPGLIPASATDIRERHSLDTNQLWVRFAFASNEPPDTSGCTRIPAADVMALSPPNRLGSDPEALGWPDDAALRSFRLECYRCEAGAFLALDAEQGVCYYWAH